jgi:hypothetical protein
MPRRRSDDSLAAVGRLRYWREADARVVVAAWRRSGQSRAAFATQHRLAVRRLARWVARLGRSSPGRVRFHPVRVVAPAEPATEAPAPALEVLLPSGCRVRVPPGVAAADLRAVVAALAAAPGGC